MKKVEFDKLLHLLALQKGEEKLKLAFGLNQLVIKIRKEGENYAKKQSVYSSRAAS